MRNSVIGRAFLQMNCSIDQLRRCKRASRYNPLEPRDLQLLRLHLTVARK